MQITIRQQQLLKEHDAIVQRIRNIDLEMKMRGESEENRTALSLTFDELAKNLQKLKLSAPIAPIKPIRIEIEEVSEMMASQFN